MLERRLAPITDVLADVVADGALTVHYRCDYQSHLTLLSCLQSGSIDGAYTVPSHSHVHVRCPPTVMHGW